MSKAAYPFPLPIKKAARRLAKEDGVSPEPVDRGRSRGEGWSCRNCGRIFQETYRKGNGGRAYEGPSQRTRCLARIRMCHTVSVDSSIL